MVAKYSVVSVMRNGKKEMKSQLKPVGLKPKYEQKYVKYLKRRYGMKRAKLFSRSISS